MSPVSSLDGPVTDDEDVNDVIVLSGPNGSGKSNLIDAVYSGNIVIDDIQRNPQIGQGQPGDPIRRFNLAQQLAAQDEGGRSIDDIRNQWVSIFSWLQELWPDRRNTPTPAMERHIRDQIKSGHGISESALDELSAASGGKMICELDMIDFRKYGPMVGSMRDPFAFSIGELFLNYQHRWEKNELDIWRVEKGRCPSAPPMSDDDFRGLFGEPPWAVMNEIIGSIGLDYRFNDPEGAEDNLAFTPRLTHRQNGSTIQIGQLSSGERTYLQSPKVFTSARTVAGSSRCPRCFSWTKRMQVSTR